MHANNSAKILKDILHQYQVEQSIVDEACRLVQQHEIGGDPRSDLLRDADSISYFEVNMSLYFQREGYEETLRRCIWGYHRLSPRMEQICRNMTYSTRSLIKIMNETIYETIRCGQWHRAPPTRRPTVDRASQSNGEKQII